MMKSFLCIFAVRYLLCKFHHQLCTVVEAVDEGFVFIGCTEAAAEIEYGVVIIQRQVFQQFIQFPEAIPDVRRIGFVGFLIGSE